MLTGLATLMIEKVPRVGGSFLETTWFHGLAKNIITYLYLQQRQNTFSSGAAVHNLSGRKACCKITVTKNAETFGMTLYYDNLSVINISKNPIQHSGTKHIDIRHHFIGSLVEDKVIQLKHVPIEHNLKRSSPRE